MFMRGKIGIQVVKLLKERNLKQREISELLSIAQPEVPHLMKGEFQRFSEGKLLIFLKRLDTEITLHIRHQLISDTRLVNDSNQVSSPLILSTTTRILL